MDLGGNCLEGWWIFLLVGEAFRVFADSLQYVMFFPYVSCNLFGFEGMIRVLKI